MQDLQEFEVTLTQNRTDTVRMWASSIIQVMDFYNTFSSASITQIKKVVYRNELSPNDFIEEKYDKGLKALIETEDKSTTFSIKFTKQNLTKEKVIKAIKENLLHLKKPIIKVNNIGIFKN